jgi:hypothetical protein
VASVEYGMETRKIRRRDRFRMSTVFGFPEPGALPSEVFESVWKQFEHLAKGQSRAEQSARIIGLTAESLTGDVIRAGMYRRSDSGPGHRD